MASRRADSHDLAAARGRDRSATRKRRPSGKQPVAPKKTPGGTAARNGASAEKRVIAMLQAQDVAAFRAPRGVQAQRLTGSAMLWDAAAYIPQLGRKATTTQTDQGPANLFISVKSQKVRGSVEMKLGEEIVDIAAYRDTHGVSVLLVVDAEVFTTGRLDYIRNTAKAHGVPMCTFEELTTSRIIRLVTAKRRAHETAAADIDDVKACLAAGGLELTTELVGILHRASLRGVTLDGTETMFDIAETATSR